MISRRLLIVALVALLILPAACTRPPAPTPAPIPTATATAQATPPTATATAQAAPPTPPAATPTPPPAATPTAGPASAADPFALISRDRLLATIQDLAAIRPHAGWRGSAARGEAEGLGYIAARLGELGYLQGLGLELERQSYRVFMATEIWQSQLLLTVDGRQVEVPADGLRGPRDDLAVAANFDTDGTIGDSASNPMVAEGPALAIRSADQLGAMNPADLRGKVVFLDYAVIDRVTQDAWQAGDMAYVVLGAGPAGLVLVTQFSNKIGESHGAYVGDVSIVNAVKPSPAPPVLYVRLEDLAPAGIGTWDDLARIQSARLTLDADVMSPATSGNLVARIPGADPSKAVILGAHVDSPNSPGAMDDGSGTAALLEVARVLDEARLQPPVDLYLAWFGSEEVGVYGSAHFAATHQELLDRTLAMLQVDCLTRPLDGINAHLALVTWSYARLGDSRMPWPAYLAKAGAERGVQAFPENRFGIESDNSTFAAFGVPEANLIYVDDPAMEKVGGAHYAGHIHDPYDTIELARQMGDQEEQMARLALTAALDTGREAPALRQAPAPDRRALFVASHTEPVHMTPAMLIELGMALAWEGYDVDMVPYGQAVTADDLKDADLVVALPVADYPAAEASPAPYDEAWSPAEVAALEEYVARGGLLVLTNSNYRLKYVNTVLDPNEDWADANALAQRLGVTYGEGALPGAWAETEGQGPLTKGVARLALAEGNGVPFTVERGAILARAGGQPAVALLDYGGAGGQVLILGDLGILGAGKGQPGNLAFWRNLAQYGRARRQ